MIVPWRVDSFEFFFCTKGWWSISSYLELSPGSLRGSALLNLLRLASLDLLQFTRRRGDPMSLVFPSEIFKLMERCCKHRSTPTQLNKRLLQRIS